MLVAVACVLLLGYIVRKNTTRRENIHVKAAVNTVLPTPEPAFDKGVSIHCSKDDFGPSTVNVYDWSKEHNTSYNCPNMKISQENIKPKICLYPPEHDIWISKVIIQTGVFERALVEFYVGKLLKNPDLAVIDVGANIGVYTLLAAAMGRQVIIHT